jgi:hypothetical protein
MARRGGVGEHHIDGAGLRCRKNRGVVWEYHRLKGYAGTLCQFPAKF